jgi:hypothetical protein
MSEALMMLILKTFRDLLAQKAGFSLIATALLIIVIGSALSLGAKFYDLWQNYKTETITTERIDDIQSSLETFLVENGRYPCPAALDAPLDSSGFGVETQCGDTAPVASGTYRALGRDNRKVRTGSVPVRTMGLPDEYIADGYSHRYIYSVTEIYADSGNPAPEGDKGAIYLRDPNGNKATSTDGNLAQMVYSMGWDKNGAYDVSGILQKPCDSSAAAGENCDFYNNAVFVNTVNKSSNPEDPFVTQISYKPGKVVSACVEKASKPPKKVAFLVDTSGSMRSRASSCPASLKTRNCRRIDVAHWAMRRLIPLRIHNNSMIDPEDKEISAGSSALTGFVGNPRGIKPDWVKKNLSDDRVIDDPSKKGYTPPDPDDLADTVENKLKRMCPSGGTPLGVHMEALAQDVGAGSEKQPNKVIVVSDGLSNNGKSPMAAANAIVKKYPNVIVDIIDVTGNNKQSQKAAEKTGGKYYNPESADDFLDDLYNASGLCGPLDNPEEPKDTIYCR